MKIKKAVSNTFGYYFKKKLVTSIIVGVLAIGVGVTAGIVIDKFFLGQTSVNYDGMSQSDYTMDTDALLAQYDSTAYTDDYSTKFKSYEMVNIAYGLYSRHENSQSITHGTVLAAGTEQYIRASNVKANGEFMEESISLGVIPVGARTYQNSENIKYISGTNIELEKATWPNECDVYSFDEYAEDFGKTPSSPLIFIISNKTVVDSSITRNGTDYVVYTKLTKKSSVLNYTKQMQKLSNLKERPTFNDISITFTLDKNLLIKEMVTQEDYFARTSSGLGSTCNGTQTVKYFVDGGFSIPDRSTPINYSLGESK